MTEQQIIEWFTGKYIEEKITISKLLREAVIKHDCTFQSLFEACSILKQNKSEKTSLGRELQYLTLMMDKGIKGSEAGKKLQAYFLEKK